ncbi:MAG: site-2 protease family protein [Bacteroidota bacterium]
MRSSIKIATVRDIPIFIHWSFSLLVMFVVYQSYSEGLSFIHILWSVAFLLVIFFCVTLHELGHALAAERYGIDTQDITLLPIGGLARLKAMPEKPLHEFVVAIAGPLVNVAIAAVLTIYLFLFENFEIGDEAYPTSENFIFFVWAVNLFLVAFNLIPAFPMDGGRMLRALLSMRFSKVRATQVASILGRILAIIFVLYGLGLYPGGNFADGNPFLALIGGFIYLSASREYQYEKLNSKLAGLTVRDLMTTNLPLPINPGTLKGSGNYKVRATDELKYIYLVMQQKRLKVLPVIDHDELVGILEYEKIKVFIQQK